MQKTATHLHHQNRLLVIPIVLFFLLFSNVFAGGKLGLYGIYMTPRGYDARDYSRPGFGFGMHVVAPFPQVSNVIAFTGGFEVINLLSKTYEFRDQVTGLRVEQQTSQDYMRIFIGGQIGGHGNGFIRPHAGVNVALILYGIGTDVVIPDDTNRENEIRQDLHDENHVVFGYDITVGVDLNFSNTWNIDGGVRFLKTFSLPQQLGVDSEKIYPEYFQIYLGVGVSFSMIKESVFD
jgi:hypothetical protein